MAAAPRVSHSCISAAKPTHNAWLQRPPPLTHVHAPCAPQDPSTPAAEQVAALRRELGPLRAVEAELRQRLADAEAAAARQRRAHEAREAAHERALAGGGGGGESVPETAPQRHLVHAGAL